MTDGANDGGTERQRTDELARLATDHGRLAIDTEFVSERRYQALLCLVQVAVSDPGGPDGVRTEVLDPLDDTRPLDAAPLAAVLADPDVEIVVHSGRQDIAILRRTWRTEIANVFDTQIAAGFLGMGNQEGYESLTRRVLGVQLRGGEGFTRWDKRPLTERQLSYAADDARCLLTLGETITRQLADVGRLEWAREECHVVERSTDERSPRRAYERLPNLRRLDAAQRAVAWRLCEWREAAARELDRPPSYLIPDQALMQLAKRRPADKHGLEQIRGLPQQTLHRRGREVLDAIAAAAGDEAIDAPPAPAQREASEAPVVSLAQALVRHRSREHKVATELIATQSELMAVVAALRRGEDPDGIRVLQGWRHELVGAELRALVDGRLAMSVAPDGSLLVEQTD
ncbi:MAG TPA: HRDC domain-containing protein [Thermoleophilaceae bacterium]|nr:HRDC domain-containing protein [Thermoleophilaceae bacterium]